MAESGNGDTARPRPDGPAGSFFNEQLLDQIREMKEDREEVLDKIDQEIGEVQKQLSRLEEQLLTFPPEDRKLMTVLVARSIKRAMREILLEEESVNG